VGLHWLSSGIATLRKRKRRIPKRVAELLTLLSGIVLTLSATYLVPHIRCVWNELFTSGHSCLRQRLYNIWDADGCGFSYQGLAVMVVAIVCLAFFTFLIWLFFGRGDDEDKLDEILDEVKGLRKDLLGSGSVTTESETKKANRKSKKRG
jgi:hypothetical protein